MKRVVAATCILVFIGLLCIVSLYFQRRAINDMQDRLDEIETVFQDGNKIKCMQLSEEFVKFYESGTAYFPFFMRHSDYDKLEENVVVLPSLLKSESTEHFEAELIKCRHRLDIMAGMETPTMENIL